MRVKSTTHARLVLRMAAVGAAVLSLFAATNAGAASTGPNIAYDELTRFVGGNQAAPQPGTFAADFQTAVASSTPAPQHHGMFGNILNSVEQMKGFMNVFTVGMASHVYYMNGWERTDQIATQQATIERPDRHEIIYLDLAKKTYRIVDTNATSPPETPAPYQPPPQSGPRPSPQPGTGKIDITVSNTSLGAKNIDGVDTTGWTQDFKMVSSQSTGSCHDGSFETAMTEYLSTYPEPHLARAPMPSHMAMPMRPQIPSAAMMGMHQGCSPTMSMHASVGASPPSDRLALWVLMQMKGGAGAAPQAQGPGGQGGSFSTLIERGNVRTLGASDASLFDVPAGFTQEQ